MSYWRQHACESQLSKCRSKESKTRARNVIWIQWKCIWIDTRRLTAKLCTWMLIDVLLNIIKIRVISLPDGFWLVERMQHDANCLNATIQTTAIKPCQKLNCKVFMIFVWNKQKTSDVHPEAWVDPGWPRKEAYVLGIIRKQTTKNRNVVKSKSNWHLTTHIINGPSNSSHKILPIRI